MLYKVENVYCEYCWGEYTIVYTSTIKCSLICAIILDLISTSFNNKSQGNLNVGQNVI